MSTGRPPTTVGTYGNLQVSQIGEARFQARTRVRDADGILRQVTARGTTAAAAKRALREKLVDRTPPSQHAITAATSVSKLAQMWLQYLRDEGRIEATTINEYNRILTKVVLPELGGLRLREVTTSRVDMFLIRLRAVSVSRQRKTKVVLNAMFGLAVRHDAMVANPTTHTARVQRQKALTRALSLAEVAEARALIRAWTDRDRPGPRASSDMADIVEMMLATGGRIGEILALRWQDIDVDAPQPFLTINGTVKTERTRGTYRKDSPKTDASVRAVALPGFAVTVLRRRRRDVYPNAIDAVFPTRNDTWQQVNNVERRWREIRRGSSLEWVTPHTFRKTVATLIAERVGAETASQQLGHTSPDITREFYIARPDIAADVAHVLDELAGSAGIYGE